MTRIAEILYDWLGWCPNSGMAGVRKAAAPEKEFIAGTHRRDQRRRQSGRMNVLLADFYEHTQRGDMIIAAFAFAILLILTISHVAGFVWVTLFVLIVLAGALLICSTLTVSVGGDALSIRFGPVGLIRKSWPLHEIESVVPVTNPWYYGLGIHATPRGVLYNVSGSKGIEVRLNSGTTFRIGTDEPEQLCDAILQACSAKNTGELS